jgi:hypothetical protein
MARRQGGSGDARRLSDDDDQLLVAALRLAGIDLPVFPLKPRDKIPLIAKADGGNGCHDATCDPDQIRAWWRRWPTANVGVATGAALWVLDLDGQDALDWISDLEDQHRWLTPGPASQTRRGVHLLFAPDPRVKGSNGTLGPGVDVKAAGGYVVVPPSIHPDTGRPYRWLPARDPWSVPLPEAPAWLLDLLDPPKAARTAAPRATPRPTTTPYVAKAFERELEAVALAGDGQRNSTLNKAAFSLSRFVAKGELDAVDVGDALVGAALAAGLNRHEATRTVMSALRAGIRRAT